MDPFPFKIVDHSKNEVKFSDLPKIKVLYFSASWCPPCRAFTPMLAKCYEALNKDSKRIEIIFVSADQDEKQFEEYYKKMPWLAIDFDEPEREEIGDKYNVKGIPFTAVIDSNGKSLYGKVRDDIMNCNGDYESCFKKWDALYG